MLLLLNVDSIVFDYPRICGEGRENKMDSEQSVSQFKLAKIVICC